MLRTNDMIHELEIIDFKSLMGLDENDHLILNAMIDSTHAASNMCSLAKGEMFHFTMADSIAVGGPNNCSYRLKCSDVGDNGRNPADFVGPSPRLSKPSSCDHAAFEGCTICDIF